MLATYNGRAVRILARAESRHRAPWLSVPDLSWLFLVNALLLQLFTLGIPKMGRMGMRDYLPAIQSSDVLIGLAAVFSFLSLVVAGRAHWTARIHRPGVAREKEVASSAPCGATILTSLALRDWEASRLEPIGLGVFSAMPLENLRASRMRTATSARSHHALAAPQSFTIR